MQAADYAGQDLEEKKKKKNKTIGKFQAVIEFNMDWHYHPSE